MAFSTGYVLVEPVASLDARQLLHALALLKELGYDGVELNVGDPAAIDVDGVAQAASDVGLAVPSLMTGAAYADGLCLSSPEAAVRRRTVARLLALVEAARRLDALLVVGLLQGLRSDEPDPAVANERIVECLREVGPAAEERGVDVVLEPVNHLQVGFNNSVREVVATIERIGSPAIRPMVDTLHLNIEERRPAQCVLDLAGRLRHVHLAESNGGLLGSANADLAGAVQALERIGYERFVCVKIYRVPEWQDAARAAIAYVEGLRASPVAR